MTIPVNFKTCIRTIHDLAATRTNFIVNSRVRAEFIFAVHYFYNHGTLKNHNNHLWDLALVALSTPDPFPSQTTVQSRFLNQQLVKITNKQE
jgi:hypothetical protein